MKAIHQIICSGCNKKLAEIVGEKGKVKRDLISYGLYVEGESLKTPGDIARAICPNCGAKTPFDRKAFLQGF